MAEMDAVVIADGNDAAALRSGESCGPVRGGINNGEQVRKECGHGRRGLWRRVRRRGNRFARRSGGRRRQAGRGDSRLCRGVR